MVKTVSLPWIRSMTGSWSFRGLQDGDLRIRPGNQPHRTKRHRRIFVGATQEHPQNSFGQHPLRTRLPGCHATTGQTPRFGDSAGGLDRGKDLFQEPRGLTRGIVPFRGEPPDIQDHARKRRDVFQPADGFCPPPLPLRHREPRPPDPDGSFRKMADSPHAL